MRDTPQLFWRITTSHAIFSVPVGDDDPQIAATCNSCGGTVGPFHDAPLDEIAKRLGEPDQVLDAFLDAWAATPVRPRWTPRLIGKAFGLAGALAGVWLVAGRLFDPGAAVGLVVGLTPIALLAHRGFAVGEGREAAARELSTHVGVMLRRSQATLAALEKRARERSYDAGARATDRTSRHACSTRRRRP